MRWNAFPADSHRCFVYKFFSNQFFMFITWQEIKTVGWIIPIRLKRCQNHHLIQVKLLCKIVREEVGWYWNIVFLFWGDGVCIVDYSIVTYRYCGKSFDTYSGKSIIPRRCFMTTYSAKWHLFPNNYPKAHPCHDDKCHCLL